MENNAPYTAPERADAAAGTVETAEAPETAGTVGTVETPRWDFDREIERRGTDCVKYDALSEVYGRADLIPLWVADMDFETPDFIVRALRERLRHPVLGYAVEPADYRPAIVDWIRTHHGWEIRPEWLAYIPGIVKGIGLAVNRFVAPDEKVINAVADVAYDAMANTLRLLNRGMLALAVRYLQKTDSVWVFGLSPNNYLGSLFCRKMLSIGKPAHVAQSGERGIVARSLGPHDCAIVISYSGNNPDYEPMLHIPALKERGVALIGVTLVPLLSGLLG